MPINSFLVNETKNSSLHGCTGTADQTAGVPLGTVRVPPEGIISQTRVPTAMTCKAVLVIIEWAAGVRVGGESRDRIMHDVQLGYIPLVS